jgi:3-deoxy-7-phosphoheptulonate synthase
MKNLKLVSLETEQRTVVDVSGVHVGSDFVVIAGPCSVESEKQLLDTARAVKAAGADGMIVEVHHNPEEALCDAEQALTPDIFSSLMQRLRPLKTFLNEQPSP